MSWKNFKLNAELDKYFTEKKFKTATAIQAKAIPEILAGENLIAISATGSGKTLAYALPTAHIVKEKENNYRRDKGEPLAIIVAPTRELALQIHQIFKELSHHLKFRARVLVGGRGSNKYFQIVKSEMDILIGTPITIKEALVKKHLNLECCQQIVLDEADQLLDMGFSRDLSMLYSSMPEQCRLSLFSATLSDELHQYILQTFTKLKFKELFLDANIIKSQRVETYNIACAEKEKQEMLAIFLGKNIQGRGIIFVNQKQKVASYIEFLAQKLPKLKVKGLHGDMLPKEREKTFKSFQEKKFQILVATDIAARGIDLDDLAWVINMELPRTHVYYLHRSGRVARGKRAGVVYNFISSVDEKKVAEINKLIKEQKNLSIDIIKVSSKNKEQAKSAGKKKVSKRDDKKAQATDKKIKKGTSRKVTKRSKLDDKNKGRATLSNASGRKKGKTTRYGSRVKKRV